MREILYRGQAKNRTEDREYRTDYQNGDWVYGLVSDIDNKYGIAKMTDEKGVSGIEVDCETICQFASITDKHNKKVFEGDILNIEGFGKAIVRFGQYCDYDSDFPDDYSVGFYLEKDDIKCNLLKDVEIISRSEIIGNIYNDTALLKGEKTKDVQDKDRMV